MYNKMKIESLAEMTKHNRKVINKFGGEIGMNPKTIDGKSGWQFCNLTTINMAACNSEFDFYEACWCASTTATIQAAFNEFPYLGEVTEKIVRGAALIGVSVSGLYDAGFEVTDEILREGAEIVKETNWVMSNDLGIMPARRTTCIKPDGNSSILLATEPSINKAHSKRYIRHIRLNKNTPMYSYIKAKYPELILCLDAKFSNGKDCVIGFPITSKDTTKVKGNETAVEQINDIVRIYENWVLAGDRNLEYTHHNVSNTVNVGDDEWENLKLVTFKNRNKIGGITFLPRIGDLVYPYSPYTAVLTDEEFKEIRDNNKELYDYFYETYSNCKNYGVDFFDYVSTSKEEERLVLLKLFNYYNFITIEEAYDEIVFDEVISKETVEAASLTAAACAGGNCSIV